MSATLELRPAGPGDMAALAQVFWRGVSEGAAPRYSPAQRAAWLPVRPDPAAFAERVAGQDVVVADGPDGPRGFMTMRADGYVDLAFVLPEARGTGVADALLALLTNRACARGLRRMTARASAMARPFFLRNGWRIVAPADVRRGDVTIPATDMTRDLSPAAR